MWQLSPSAYQYERQQHCECGKNSQHCPFCVKTQTPQTDFVFHHLHHKANALVVHYAVFYIWLSWSQLWELNSGKKSWQYQNLTNLFSTVQSQNSTLPKDNVIFVARTSAILVLKVPHFYWLIKGFIGRYLHPLFIDSLHKQCDVSFNPSSVSGSESCSS